MSADELENTEPPRLAEMLSLDQRVGQIWQPEELAAILRHQLGARLDVDLGDLSEAYAIATPQGEAGRLRWEVTFGELLSHPKPALPLLERAKRFAKACKSHPDGPLPTEVATVLYFACIIVAQLRCGKRISALDDESLIAGMEWALAQNWLDEAIRILFINATSELKRDLSGS
jgi:hypothetical protein